MYLLKRIQQSPYIIISEWNDRPFSVRFVQTTSGCSMVQALFGSCWITHIGLKWMDIGSQLNNLFACEIQQHLIAIFDWKTPLWPLYTFEIIYFNLRSAEGVKEGEVLEWWQEDSRWKNKTLLEFQVVACYTIDWLKKIIEKLIE